MIPRQIISAWFGPGGPENHDKYAHCIASWRKVLPDWPIIFVRNLSGFGLDHCAYVRSVSERARSDPREWVKLTEIARLAALHAYGGVYLDCDVELLKPLDPLLGHDFFIGREDGSTINGAVIGAVRTSPIVARLLQRFPLNGDGAERATTYGPVSLTAALSSEPQLTPTILPPEYFYPWHWAQPREAAVITENTYAIHHWSGGWK